MRIINNDLRWKVVDPALFWVLQLLEASFSPNHWVSFDSATTSCKLLTDRGISTDDGDWRNERLTIEKDALRDLLIVCTAMTK